MRRPIFALVLLASLVTAAHARGVKAHIEGPTRDGSTYTVRMQSLRDGTPLEPWALAEGVVDGKSRSVLLRVEPTGEPGVYRFKRAWPNEGRWAIRMCPGNPAIPTTVALVRTDGSVKRQTFHRHTDGMPECLRALGVKPGEGC